MNAIKRSYTSPKGVNRNTSKGKDPAKLNFRQKTYDVPAAETETHSLSLPLIKQIDNARLLPKYTAILTRIPEYGVVMKDLDQLQQDLENLLSTCAVRHKSLKSEFDSLDRSDERKDRKGKPSEKQYLKRRKIDEKGKYKDTENGVRILKTKPINNFISDLPLKQEVPKVSLPRNDTDKFWLSVEPFCCDISKEDVNFLDELINECSQEIDIKIPDIGEHYAIEWTENTLVQEQQLGNVGKPLKVKNTSYNNDIKKNVLNAIVDTFHNPLTQGLLSALIEEKVFKSYPTTFEKLKASDFIIKANNGPRGGSCLDRRLRKELVEQGILDVDDLPKTYPPDDILAEIKKCQQELAVVNEHNQQELSKLRTVVAKDMRRQEVKAALDKVDNQIMQLYNNIFVLKQKEAVLEEDELLLTKQTLEENEKEAKKFLEQQAILHKELTELTDLTMLF